MVDKIIPVPPTRLEKLRKQADQIKEWIISNAAFDPHYSHQMIETWYELKAEIAALENQLNN